MSEKDLKLMKKIKRKKPSNISEPRISPVDKRQSREFVNKMLNKSEWDRLVENTIESLKQYKLAMRRLDIFKILMRNPDLLMNSSAYLVYHMDHSTISIRDREMLILRIAWLSGTDYMWFQHKTIGVAMAGLSGDEIERIKQGPDVEGWEDFDATLLRAVDELHIDAFISDATWKALSERYSANQLLDMLSLASHYFGLGMVLKTLGVQPEP